MLQIFFIIMEKEMEEEYITMNDLDYIIVNLNEKQFKQLAFIA